jgi:hypothetical protein
VRKALLILGVLAALAIPAVATAKAPPPKAPTPSVICGTSCDSGGSGWTGCSSATASDSQGFRWVSWYRHYLVVNYCKVNGLITSASIAAHGCDYEGVIVCSTGPAWLTSGGVGTGWASFTGHATYIGAIAGVPWAGTSTINVNIPLG